MTHKKKSRADLAHLRTLVQLVEKPTPLSKEDVEAMLIPSSWKLHGCAMVLWIGEVRRLCVCVCVCVRV